METDKPYKPLSDITTHLKYLLEDCNVRLNNIVGMPPGMFTLLNRMLIVINALKAKITILENSYGIDGR